MTAILITAAGLAALTAGLIVWRKRISHNG